MIRVAIADDSPFTCKLLASYLEEGGDCQVVGVAHDAASTLEMVRKDTPDVLTLDLQMPGVSGLELLRDLSAGPPVAIVVISGVTRLAAATTLRALELGAVDFVLKYTPGAPVSRVSLKREILAKVKMAAAARPAVRPAAAGATMPGRGLGGDGFTRLSSEAAAPRGVPRPVNAPGAATMAAIRLVVIGASTGGPRAIAELLEHLPADFAVPCVVVQHLPAIFTAPFAAQLGRRARITVNEAASGDRLEPGRVLVTPGAYHLRIRAEGVVELEQAAETDVYRPSIDLTMASAAESFGASTIGVILTGMGHDGAEGLKRIREAGGETYVQDLASCVVTSMPERALERAGADHVARPDRIGQMLAGRSR